jgi:hypothetical protein
MSGCNAIVRKASSFPCTEEKECYDFLRNRLLGNGGRDIILEGSNGSQSSIVVTIREKEISFLKYSRLMLMLFHLMMYDM